MKLSDVSKILEAEVLCKGEMLEKREVGTAYAADLMSDVLLHTKEKTLLLTALTSQQVVRTAEISDLIGIVFVRSKRPSDEVIQMAAESELPLMITEYTLYEACGILFSKGLKG